MHGFAFSAVRDISGHLRCGDTSSEDIVSGCLDAVARIDDRLHAFVTLFGPQALTMSRQSDVRRKAGFSLGPLDGIPFAVKDILHVQGHPTTAGSRSRKRSVSHETAASVVRLMGAGMIPLGKTHMVELAYGTWGVNSAMGTPRNPWDGARHRIAGGSSSGSAVAVAAGMVPAALGTDTGGSIRIPAGLCGISGLKPTFGRVDAGGCIPLSASLDTVGPMARTADDLAMLFAVLCAKPVPQVAEERLNGLRITLATRGYVEAHSDAAVIAVCRNAAQVLRELGAQVSEDPVPWDWESATNDAVIVTAAEAIAEHGGVLERPLEMDAGVRARLEAARGVTAAEYMGAQSRMKALGRTFEEWMAGRDMVLVPALPQSAVLLDDVDEAIAPLAAFTRAVNFFGGCALALPAGEDSAGLPLSIQLIGPAGADERLLAAGTAFQQATEWHLRTPDISPFLKQQAAT